MTIALTGSSGFVGSYLNKYFSSKNYKIILIDRADFKDESLLRKKVLDSDIVINLVGANIMRRWTDAYKKEMYHSRIDNTKKIVQAINANTKKQLLISTSAIGIYSDDIVNDENSYKYGDTFLTSICKDWEMEAKKANARVVICRFGVVLGDGGALNKMLLPFKLGLGGKIASGKQSFTFIHILDLARAQEFLIKHKSLDGVFNFCAPYPITNLIFTKVLAHTLKRPAFLPVPGMLLKLIFGDGSDILIGGQHVYPKRLLENNFKFNFETIEGALKNLLTK